LSPDTEPIFFQPDVRTRASRKEIVMSGSSSRLPARPSLEHLRNQAKDLLHSWQAGDSAGEARVRVHNPRATTPSLADAQYALAREYGFESWPKLVHHIEDVRSQGRLAQFEGLAADLLAAYAGDADALRRLGTHFGVSYTADSLRERVRERLDRLPGIVDGPTLADVRRMIARQYGFEDWAGLAEGLAQPAGAASDTRLGLTSSPPFYRIDDRRDLIEPRPPLSDRDWDAVFAVMAERGITGLRASCMTDSALDRLSRLDFVTHINLDGARQVTDDGIRHLARMPRLEELDLSGYHSHLTDRGLEVLRHLANLRHFKMCWPQNVTDDGVAHLAWCDHLERVNLLGTPTGDGAIAALAGKRRLRHLLAGCRVTAAGLPLLHEIPRFRVWGGGEPSYGLMGFEADPTYLLLPPVDAIRRGLDGLVGLDGLFALNIDGPEQVAGDQLAPLTQLPHLGWLGVDPDDEAMCTIAAMPRLRMLMCQDTKASDDGFVALGASRSIEYIWGRKCYGLAARGFAALATMPALRGLSVSCRNVDDAGLSALPHFPALRELMPMDVPDDGFRHVGRCERLESLHCMYCRDTGDAATQHIAGLPRLTTYYAGQTRITDRSLEVLGRIGSLERVQFEGCAGVTDAGLAHLTRLPRLREIILGGCPGITRAGAAGFPATVRVDYDG
jgi:hypothetical protein